MSTTFAELGIPFPLFKAPIACCSQYLGAGKCCLCGKETSHVFRVGEILVGNRWRGTWGEDHACHSCLSQGKAAFVKDTVHGMVDMAYALAGLTHGLPGQSRTDFELVPSESDPEWLRARIASEHLLELVRTPGFITWQGDIWDFCCQRPMPYLGDWKQPQFRHAAVDGNGRSLLATMGIDADMWEHLSDVGGVYVFQCELCARYSGYFDCD